MLTGVRNWLARRRRSQRQPLIIVGIGVPAWEAHRRLAGGWHTIAFIDENPWNHRTLVDGVAVYYPSEITSLCRRHGVRLVLFTEPESWQRLAPQLTQELTGLGVDTRLQE